MSRPATTLQEETGTISMSQLTLQQELTQPPLWASVQNMTCGFPLGSMCREDGGGGGQQSVEY